MISARVIARGAALAVCLAGTAAATPLTAQTGFEFTPFVGAYVPLGDLFHEIGGSAKQQIGPMYGIRTLARMTPKVGAELLLAYGMANVEGDNETDVIKAASRTLLASGRARWRASGAEAAWPMFLSGGLAVISHGGDAFEPLEGTTDIGLTIGAGTERTVRDRLRLRIDVEDYISSASFTFGGEESESKLQNDIMVSVGLSLSVAGVFARR